MKLNENDVRDKGKIKLISYDINGSTVSLTILHYSLYSLLFRVRFMSNWEKY